MGRGRGHPALREEEGSFGLLFARGESEAQREGPGLGHLWMEEVGKGQQADVWRQPQVLEVSSPWPASVSPELSPPVCTLNRLPGQGRGRWGACRVWGAGAGDTAAPAWGCGGLVPGGRGMQGGQARGRSGRTSGEKTGLSPGGCDERTGQVR